MARRRLAAVLAGCLAAACLLTGLVLFWAASGTQAGSVGDMEGEGTWWAIAGTCITVAALAVGYAAVRLWRSRG